MLNNVYVSQQQNLARRFDTSMMHLSPPPLPVAYTAVRSIATFAVVALLIIVLPLFDGVLCLVHIFLFSSLCPSCFAIIFMGKRELFALP